MNKLVSILLVFCLAGLAFGQTKKQVQFVDEWGKPVNMGTSVSLYIYNAGTTTEQNCWLDKGRTRSCAQPITDNSTNTPLDYVTGMMEFWSVPGSYRAVVDDGTYVRSVDNLTGSDTRIMWPSFLTAMSAYSLGQSDDLDFAYASWIIDGDTANRLDIIPDADGGVLGIGDTTHNADVYIYAGVSAYLFFDEGNKVLNFVDIDLDLDDDAALNFGSDDDATARWYDGAGVLSLAVTGKIDVNSTDDIVISIAGAAGEDFILTNTGGSIILTATESAVDSIKIESTYGGIDILASGAAAGEDIDLIATGSSINLTSTEGAANQIYIQGQGTVSGNAVNIATTNGGIILNAGGAANGDVAVTAANTMVLTASPTVQVAAALTVNTVGTFGDEDAHPDVSGKTYWNTNTTATTIEDFDGTGIAAGQLLIVTSKGTITYDVTSSGIKGGTTDIITGAGDVTTFIYDGTDWLVVARMDMSANLN